jgi:uncharacterized damage-inducible protein DinB
MSDSPFLDDALGELRKYKKMAEGALAQISDKQWFAVTDAEANSVGIIVKHMTGNMRSRWTDFLTTDGEKANRARDTEFELYPDDTVAGLKGRWDAGWKLVFDTLEPLQEKDLNRKVTIRGEPHTVLQAVMRQLTHYSSHIGQIVFLCRQLVGPKWKSLSIPRGQSKAFEVSKSGAPYKPADKKKK